MQLIRTKGKRRLLLAPILVLMGALLLPSGAAQAQFACVSNGTGGGLWSDPATWVSCDGGIPNAVDDDATILGGDTVTLDIAAAANRQVRDLAIDIGGTLNFNSGQLRITSDMTVNGTFDAAAGTSTAFNSAGLKTLSGAGDIQFAELRVTTNTLEVDGGTALSVSENFQVLTRVNADSTSTVTFNGGGVQLWDLDTGGFDIMQLGNVVIDAGSTVNTVGAGLTNYRISGNFTNNGTFDAQNDRIAFNTPTNNQIGGTGDTQFDDLFVQLSATLLPNTTIQIGGDMTFNGWSTADDPATVIFNGGGPSTITYNGNPNFNFYQLDNLTVTNNTDLTLPNTATARIGGDVTVDFGSTLTAVDGSVVAFNDFDFGPKSITAAPDSLFFHDVRFTANTTSLAANAQMNVRGDMDISANFDGSAGSVTFDGGTTQEITGDASSAQFGFLAVSFNPDTSNPTTLNSNMTNPFELQVSEAFAVDTTYNADANTTIVFDNPGNPVNAIVNGAANLQDVVVTSGTTLDELVGPDTIAVAGTITNNGIINKPGSGGKGLTVGPNSFGLAQGNLPAGETFVNVNTLGEPINLNVSWVGNNSPNAGPDQQTGNYWILTAVDTFNNPTSVSGYDIDLTLPHDGVPDPGVCLYTGTDYDCSVSDAGAGYATRIGITDFTSGTETSGEWLVGANSTADLSVSKTSTLTNDADGNTVPSPGDTITYTVTVTNNGPSAADNVQVADALPAQVTYVSDDSGGAYNTGTGQWAVGTLASGADATLSITVTINGGTAGQTVTNEATASTTQSDLVTDNNSNSAVFVVGAATADVSVAKQVALANADGVYDPGDTVIYTLTATNNGTADTTGVTVNDTLPTGVTYASDSGGGAYDTATGNWTVGALNSGADATLDITVTVNADATGTVTNTATVTANDLTDPNADNNAQSVAFEVSGGETPPDDDGDDDDGNDDNDDDNDDNDSGSDDGDDDDNDAPPQIAAAQPTAPPVLDQVTRLPATGETPAWRNAALAVLVGVGVAVMGAVARAAR